jgi:hypothetical protein
MSTSISFDSKFGSLNEFLKGSVPNDSSTKAAEMLKNLYDTYNEQSRSPSPTATKGSTAKKSKKHKKLSLSYRVDTEFTTQPTTRAKVTPLPPISVPKSSENMDIKKRIEYLK